MSTVFAAPWRSLPLLVGRLALGTMFTRARHPGRDCADAAGPPGRAATAFTPAVETELRGSSLYLVLAGAGAAVLPRTLAELGRAGGVVIVPFDPPQSRHSYVLRRAALLSPAAQALHSLLRRGDNRSAGAV
ncbi:LysR family transcriptional regulator substrate-binding protein [Streptomyces sp. NPDC048324]|uniref:LysR family transcriptional regulator substrate-binding protein n=1 Tax=Streptomyces sp. NPDC048324 TaxID=3157205 RepID=UPI0034228F9E